MRSRLTIVGPVESVHVRTWIHEFCSRGWEVQCISGASSAAFAKAVARSWLQFGRAADVTIVHSLGRHALLALMCRTRGRLVVVPWGSEVFVAPGHRGRSAVAAALLRRADLVLTTSRHMADTITRTWPVLPDRVRTVSWGIDDWFLDTRSDAEHIARLRKSVGCSDGELLVLAPRGAGAVYRHDIIVRAVETARACGARLRLVTIVSSASRPVGSPGDVTLPTLSKRGLRDLFGAADAVVSIPPSDQRSTTVLEALSTGVRVLTSTAPPYQEIRDDGADLVLLQEPVEPALVEALTALAQPKTQGGARSEANRAWCSTHERRSQNFDLIERLCRGEPCTSG